MGALGLDAFRCEDYFGNLAPQEFQSFCKTGRWFSADLVLGTIAQTTVSARHLGSKPALDACALDRTTTRVVRALSPSPRPSRASLPRDGRAPSRSILSAFAHVARRARDAHFPPATAPRCDVPYWSRRAPPRCHPRAPCAEIKFLDAVAVTQPLNSWDVCSGTNMRGAPLLEASGGADRTATARFATATVRAAPVRPLSTPPGRARRALRAARDRIPAAARGRRSAVRRRAGQLRRAP